MGKYSNIVLVENGVILGALKTSSLDDNLRRILFSGAKYEYPAPQDKISVFDGAGMRALIDGYVVSHGGITDLDDFSRFLFEGVSGFAYPTLRELVKKLGTKDIHTRLVWAFENLENAPCVVYENGAPTDFFAFQTENGVERESLYLAEDEFYSYREHRKSFENKKRKLESSVRGLKKKQAKRIQDVLERLRESENAELNKIKGELLTANLYRLERGMKECILENWYEADCPKIKIALDELLSPQKNAQRYFKTYNKQKRAKEILTPMLKTEQEEGEYLESVSSSIELAETIEDFKEIEEELIAIGVLTAPKERAGGKKKQTETQFREYEYQGFKIYAGRNNVQNDRLLRLASPSDIWLHTQKYHSSHVIIVTEGRAVPDAVLGFASEICAYYSDGRFGDKIPVDYCERRFVKKPSKSKAGFVIYTDYKTVLVTPNSHKND